MFTIRPGVTPDEIKYVAANMRGADVAEVWATSGFLPEPALDYSVDVSEAVWTWLEDDVPIAVFGVGEYLPDTGSPWFLATPHMHRADAQVFFVRNTQRVLDAMHRVGYPILMQYVHAKHLESLRWLQWAGFSLNQFYPAWGFAGEPFFRLSKVKSCANP